MRGYRGLRVAGIVAAAMTLIGLSANVAAAQENGPGKLTDIWLVWPKAGQTQEFEAAVKGHVAWRKQAGEPFTWTAVQPVVGDDLTHYVFLSSNRHWKDFDRAAAWTMESGAGVHFNDNVMPHVERAVHHISEVDSEHSRWQESEDYTLFSVTAFHVRPGAEGKMMEALGQVHKALGDADWPHSYSISRTLGGAGGMTVVSPYRNWAEMEEPEPSFMEVMAKSLGSPQAAGSVMSQLSGSFESSDTTIYATRPDLSTPQ